jgi:hypothetical protein
VAPYTRKSVWLYRAAIGPILHQAPWLLQPKLQVSYRVHWNISQRQVSSNNLTNHMPIFMAASSSRWQWAPHHILLWWHQTLIHPTCSTPEFRGDLRTVMKFPRFIKTSEAIRWTLHYISPPGHIKSRRDFSTWPSYAWQTMVKRSESIVPWDLQAYTFSWTTPWVM